MLGLSVRIFQATLCTDGIKCATQLTWHIIVCHLRRSLVAVVVVPSDYANPPECCSILLMTDGFRCIMEIMGVQADRIPDEMCKKTC